MLVLDTNVLYAAAWSRLGASFRLVELALQGRLEFAVSVALALEYEAVLMRDTTLEASWATTGELDSLLDGLLASATLVMPVRTRLRPASPDPADDMVVECAVQAGANAIVTLNIRDFASSAKLYRVDVVEPREALRRWRAAVVN